MRKLWRTLSFTALLFAIPFVSLHAQATPSCGVIVAIYYPNDVCQKTRDVFEFIAPQLGIALAGGNPMPGEGGSLGGSRWRTASLRVVALEGRAPANNVPLSITGAATPADLGARKIAVPVPSLDAALGLLEGFNIGVTNVGGVDLIMGLVYIPTVNKAPYRLKPEGSGIATSYGVRVGVLQETSIVPGVGLTWMKRRLPRVNASYTPNDDTLRVTRVDERATALRLTASKHFSIIGIAAGVGQDKLETTAGLDAVVHEPIGGADQRATLSQALLIHRATRSTVFGNLSVGKPRARVVGEYGWSGAGSVRQTVNTFGEHRANEGYRYGSLGITFRF